MKYFYYANCTVCAIWQTSKDKSRGIFKSFFVLQQSQTLNYSQCLIESLAVNGLNWKTTYPRTARQVRNVISVDLGHDSTLVAKSHENGADSCQISLAIPFHMFLAEDRIHPRGSDLPVCFDLGEPCTVKKTRFIQYLGVCYTINLSTIQKLLVIKLRKIHDTKFFRLVNGTGSIWIVVGRICK